MTPFGSGARWRAAFLLVISGPLAACFPLAQPRLPQSVAAALAQHPMRSTESEHLRLYFPEGREDEARRFLGAVEVCAGKLARAAHVHNGIADQKMVVMLPELPFNNAFVVPRILGYDTEAVIPTYNTVDLFLLEMGLAPDPAEIACHELTHYVQFQQIAGFSWFVNAAFGATYSPQIGLDAWFDEGLAVYYETQLRTSTGRLRSPFWRGAFAAAFAGKRINGGDLHALNRDFHAGNHYLVGSQFVRFLADRYGEDRLWRLVEVQAHSLFFPLWVNLRFWQAYDKSLSTLIDEFADEVETNLRPRERPPGQRVVRAAGNSARYARAADGTEAMITQDQDRPPRLIIHAPDGRVRVERELVDVVPPRQLAIASAVLTSGLSFTAEARSLYFVAVDLDATFQAARLLRYDLDTDRLLVVNRDVRGTGGSVTPDGMRYLFAQANGDHHDLAELDLRTGGVRMLAPQVPGAFIGQPRVSPDGKRVVATQFDGTRFRIVVYDAVTGALLTVVAGGGSPAAEGHGQMRGQIQGQVNDPSWIDDQRILFLGTELTDAGFQLYVHQLNGGYTSRVTNAPYLAFQPRAAGGRALRFLNREGWGWTLDEVALPAPLPVAPTPAVAAPPPEGIVARADTDADPEPSPLANVPVEPAGTPGPAAIAPPVDPVGTPVGASAAPAAPPPQPPVPSVDRPYRPTDHLFVPLLHGPTVQSVGRRALTYGLVLSGNDRLSMHRWTLAGYYQSVAAGGSPSFLAGYSNRQLAPFTFNLLASQFEAHDAPPVPVGQPTPNNPAYTLFRRDRLVSANVERAFYGNPVSLGGSFIETYQPGDPSVLQALRRFAGPRLSASYTGAEATPYTGVRRLFAASGEVAAYPRAWNTAGVEFVDTRAELDAVIPLPLLRRHSLTLAGRLRDLVGLPARQPLLIVGGYTSALLRRQSTSPEVLAVEPALLPPGVSFAEPLRGFEDYPLLTDRIYIADATYLYPFIIDWGTASTLAVLPAFFLSQVDLELFASAATVARQNDRHLAVGGALSIRMALWLPFTLQYQVARRATDDHGLVQLVTLGM